MPNTSPQNKALAAPLDGLVALLSDAEALARLPALTPPYDRALLALRAEGWPAERAAALISQAKLRDKARLKLPHFVAAGCLFHPEGYEQASGHKAAALKLDYLVKILGANDLYKKGVGTKLCVDLTAGLGADAFVFASHFEQVIAVEPDPVRAALLRFNARQLGFGNIDVQESTAEAFVALHWDRSASDTKAAKLPDFVYLDPARRTDLSAKAIALEHCLPHVPTLLPALRALGCPVLFKLSPLFEVAELARQLGPHTAVAALSVDGECKELLACLQGDSAPEAGPLYSALGSRSGHPFAFSVHKEPEKHDAYDKTLLANGIDDIDEVAFLLEPDVAFYKAQLVAEWVAALPDACQAKLTGPSGYVLCKSLPESQMPLPARVMRIVHSGAYHGRALKLLLREKGIKRANISRKNFPFKVEDIRQTLRIDEGGDDYLFFTTLHNERVVFWCKHM